MKTKIIATYGPAIHSGAVLKKIIGHVDVFRINMSHGSSESWLEYIDKINAVSRSRKKEVALLADLPGPKIRLGNLKEEINVKKGSIVAFKYGESREGEVPLDFDIHKFVKKGSRLSIGDGIMDFLVEKVSKRRVISRAINAGVLLSRKGINISNGSVSAASPTKDDIRLAKFAKKNGFDFIAMSFVKSASDINTMRKKCNGMDIIAKIERNDAVNNISGILEASDAIMVARGDLAFEVKVEMLPIIQFHLINAARAASKPVIVATQMLASMVNSPMPTRAEVTDIATAVTSGADCVMLSEETAVGKYPLDAVNVLATTAKNAQSIITSNKKHFKISGINDSIAFAAADIADNYRTDCIFAPTHSGATAKKLSALRPESNIIALCNFESVRKKLKIFYGVNSEPIKQYEDTDSMLSEIKRIATRKGFRKYIVVSGSPHQRGSTNTLKYIEH
jgi:pyruvate kinase